MTDDTPIPEDDALAEHTRHALQRLAGGNTEIPAWTDVQTGARRFQRRRLAAVGVACAVVLAGAGTAAAVAHGAGKPVGVGDNGTPSSTAASTTTRPSTTTTSEASTSTTVASVVNPPTTPGSVPGQTVPHNSAPQPGDFSGAVVIGNPDVSPPQGSVPVGESVNINASVHNVSDHAVWGSSSTVPTSLATICTGTAPGTQSLWWMTNILLAPGDADGRDGTFTPTAAYTGTVTCELDIVTTDQHGIAFDTAAGGDMATASIVGRVLAVAPVTVQVVPAPWTVTTTGKVGPLQFGTSTAADVRAAVGTPDATTTGTFGVPSFPDYNALGYDCSAQPATGRIPLHVQPQVQGPFCRTIFFVNTSTNTLAGFETTSDHYATEQGTAVGMTTAEAERRESQTVLATGCRASNLSLGSPDSPHSPGAIILDMGTKATDLVTKLTSEDDQIQVGVEFC